MGVYETFFIFLFIFYIFNKYKCLKYNTAQSYFLLEDAMVITEHENPEDEQNKAGDSESNNTDESSYSYRFYKKK